MRKKDAVLGIFLLIISLVGIIFIVPRETYSLGYEAGLSPAFFPYLVLCLLGGLSGLLAISNLVKGRAEEPFPLFENDTLKKFILSCCIVFGACLTLNCLGFLIVGPLTVAAAMWLMGCRSWVQLAFVSPAGPILLYFIFSILLRQPLPKGIFF
jgi:hypothetical protein